MFMDWKIHLYTVKISILPKFICGFKNEIPGNSLAVQWLGLSASSAGGTASIPGWETNILHAAWCGQKKKKGIKMQFLPRSQQGFCRHGQAYSQIHMNKHRP